MLIFSRCNVDNLQHIETALPSELQVMQLLAKWAKPDPGLSAGSDPEQVGLRLVCRCEAELKLTSVNINCMSQCTFHPELA